MKKFLSISLISLAAILLAAVLFFSIRNVAVARAIETEWLAQPAVVPQLAATSHLEIIPLYEAESTDAAFIKGHGVSYLIRTDSATLLLDVGDNPEQASLAPFMSNLQALGLDWDEITRVVISHPHPDHLGGVRAWREHTVRIGDLDLPAALGARLLFVPAPVTLKNAVHATIPTLPAPDVATTGVIPYAEIFPISLFEPKGGEQALVVHVAGKGLVVITGCGHPGLEKLVERAEKLYGQPVVGVVGGLHYLEISAEEALPHIEFLQTRPIELIALSPHDSGPSARAAFEQAFPAAYQPLAVGATVHLP